MSSLSELEEEELELLSSQLSVEVHGEKALPQPLKSPKSLCPPFHELTGTPLLT